MKQIERQKSISWFKLAEFVERGEKERALGMYKLLALSINDTAFAYQLEGDILLAFADELAINKYLQAAEYYIKQNNILAAIGTLNHLIILAPNNIEVWETLSDIYLKYLPAKIMLHFRNMINNKQQSAAQNLVEKIVNHTEKDIIELLNNLTKEIKSLDTDLYHYILQKTLEK